MYVPSGPLAPIEARTRSDLADVQREAVVFAADVNRHPLVDSETTLKPARDDVTTLDRRVVLLAVDQTGALNRLRMLASALVTLLSLPVIHRTHPVCRRQPMECGSSHERVAVANRSSSASDATRQSRGRGVLAVVGPNE